MLDRLRKLFNRDSDSPSLTTLSADEHQIDFNLVSPNAMKVVETLQNAGYAAYIVGGGVRDLLLDAHPKDFDVATDATPEQVKKCFRNALLIGRRFRIVHVRFGREIIEVTTFRGHHSEAQTAKEANQAESGILLRDNVYGDIQSDAMRRDFTINALYLDTVSGELHDFANGIEDLNKRYIRMIGKPTERYKEDPVRLLRAIRFAAKLSFKIEEQTRTPIESMGPSLEQIPAARMFDESLKLLVAGNATATLDQLLKYDLLRYLFPSTVDFLEDSSSQAYRLIEKVAINTDKRIRQGKRVTPAFIFAAMLWPALQARMNQILGSTNMSQQDAMYKASHEVISQQSQATSIPKRFLIPMREIWSLQQRLPKRDSRRVYTVLNHPRFRAAYDFVLLREESGENLGGLGDWWTEFQHANEDQQEAMLKESKPKGNRKPRKRRPRNRNKHQTQGPEAPQD